MHRILRAGKVLLFCLAVSGVVAAGSLAPVRAQATPAAPAAAQAGRVAGQATWDADFLYLAFQVDDANLEGTNTAPMSRPQEDDSVAVYLQVGPGRPDAPNDNTHAMIVSAAGGFTFLHGEGGQLVPRPLFTIKYAVSLQGTLNRGDDRDQRFTVEMAIPWKDIGVQPQPGMVLGYNAVVRARGGGLTAIAENVKTEADVPVPSKWARLTLAAAGAASGEAGTVAPQVVPSASPPLVNGVLAAGEWPDNSRFAFVAPEKVPPPAVAVRPAPTAPERAKPAPLRLDRPLLAEHLLMARYDLGFQGDPRKLIGFRGVRAPSGRFLLSDQPASGAGPWFSSDRTSWHRSQLIEMRRLGVDVALTVVGGPDGEAGLADEKALMVMVAALRELAAEQIATPQVALWLDTKSLVAPGAPAPDLTKEEGRALLYGAIRRWFQIVPSELRARVQLPVASGGACAYPVFLSTASGFAAAGGDWAEDLRGRFAADFGADTTLLLSGGEDFAPNAGMAAFLPVNAWGKGRGPLATFVVQPGYDDSAVAAPGRAAIRMRRDGGAYKEAWDAALAASPRWVILDSWNDWARGTEVSASRQYGSRYLDQTRIYSIAFNGLRPFDVKWLSHNAPMEMRPLQVVTVDLRLQNAGATPWLSGAGLALSYRWLQNGRVVAESPVRVPILGRGLFPTQIATLSLGLAAVRADAAGKLQPLPPGKYVAQIDLNQVAADGKRTWFGDEGDAPLEIPITIAGDAPESVSFGATSVSPLMLAGGAYPATVRVRWQGAQPLAADAATLTYQLLSGDGTRTIASGSFPLSQPLTPGQWTTLRAPLRLAESDGSPIAPAAPEGRGEGYRLRWLLTRTQATEAIPGVYSEYVAVYPAEAEARVLRPNRPPTSMDADAIVPMEVTIVNRGQAKWARGEMLVGYHWYYPDGVEAEWKGKLNAPIAEEVAPGKSVKVRVLVRAPERDGPYILAFDVARGPDSFLSTRPITQAGDLGLIYLRVKGGRLGFVDLSRFFDVDAVAFAANPADGNFNGNGSTFPAESFPPDNFGLNAPPETNKKSDDAPAYPSGYYADVSPTARLISFRYGPNRDKASNAVVCKGQEISVPRGRYIGLHLAVAATGGDDRPLPIVLRYRDNSTQTIARVAPDWGRAPKSDEPVAILAGRKRTPQGDVAGTAALRHVIVPVSITKDLVGVTLPNDPAIKVFAITLER